MTASQIIIGGDVEFQLTFSQDLVDRLEASVIAGAIRERYQVEAVIERGPHGAYTVRVSKRFAGLVREIAEGIAKVASEKAAEMGLDCEVKGP